MRISLVATLRLFRLLLPSLGVLGIMVILGLAFYVRGSSIMDEQLRQNLRSVAAVAALQIDGDLLDSIDDTASDGLPAYRTLVRQLRAVRTQVPTIRFAYILRRTEDPRMLEFVADADALSSVKELDRNGNGAVDEDEEAALPGDEYDISEAPALQGDAFMRPTVDREPTVDQWGTLFSGYAPVRRSDGSVAGVIGVDMNAAEYVRLRQSVFSPIALLLVMTAGTLLAAQLGFLQWRRQMQSLRQMDDERLALMNLASHQLGGPVATFKWWLELLHEGGEGVDPKQAYEELSIGVTRIESIMKALQAANRFAQKRVNPRSQTVDLREIAATTLEDVRSRMHHRHAKIRADITADPLSVRVDPDLLSGAIGELLENATQYAPKSTVMLRVCAQGNKAVIEVQDDGRGIEKDDLHHLFEKFSRGKTASQFKTGGNGLGLYIVKTIVEMSGGKIAVRSREGETVFTITLPLA